MWAENFNMGGINLSIVEKTINNAPNPNVCVEVTMVYQYHHNEIYPNKHQYVQNSLLMQ